MENQNRQGIKDKIATFLKDKGIYVVLLVSIAVVGTAAALAFWPATEQEVPSPDASLQAEPVSMSEDERLEDVQQEALLPTATPEVTPTPTPTQIPDFTQKPAPTAAQKVDKVSSPVSGSIVWGFAMDQLIYSKTLDQWMTHSGVDVASPKGTEVYTIYSGTVEAVYEDDLLGVTVEVSHSNGMKSVYANLKKDPPVKEGRKVNAGDCIGYVGDTAAAECLEQSHLHFELHIDGKPVNPDEYVLFKR